MKSFSAFVICCFFFTHKLMAQKSEVFKVFKNIYRGISTEYRHTYVLDGSTLSFGYSYEKLQPNVKPNDTTILKSILKYGKKIKVLNTDVKNSFSADKLITMKKFNELNINPIAPNIEEKAALHIVDSLMTIWSTISGTDSIKYKEIYNELEAMTKSDIYKNYVIKESMNSKWLFVIQPYYSYKNYRLLILERYQSSTNSELIVKIISL